MKKVLKWLGLGVLALVTLVVVLVLALPLWIGPVATGVANCVAPRLLGTAFHLDAFALNPYTGRIFIGGVALSNPPGYDEPMAVSVDAVNVSLSFPSLLSQKIRVYDVAIENPYVSYVNDAGGTNNFDRILTHLTGAPEAKAEAPAPAAEASAPAAKKPSKGFQIDRISISGTRVKILALPAIPVPVPTLENIGTDDDGATLKEIADAVWNSIKGMLSTTQALFGNGLKSLGDLGATTSAGAQKALGDMGAGAQKALGDVGAGAQKAIENLGGLFKTKK